MSADAHANFAGQCPTIAEWQAALRGDTDQTRWTEIELHLLNCPDCEATVDALTEQSDTCVRGLCQGPAIPEDEAVFQALYDRLVNSAELSSASQADVGNAHLELPFQLGSYELLEALGHGANGSVFKARHLMLDRPVAIKLLRPDLDFDPASIDRFVQEARAIGKADHPHIVRATDAGVTDGQHFLVMEYVPGIDVSSALLKCGPLRVADACEIARQTAFGLSYLHKHDFVHRDVKPSNLLLTAEGQTKLLDLGLVQFVGEPSEHADHAAPPHGTADYMAPEQWNDFERVDPRSDLYSLGCALAKLLTSVPPFRPLPAGCPTKCAAHCKASIPDLRALRPEIPDALQSVFEKLLAKRPEQRFPTAADAADALEPFVRGADLPRLSRSAGLVGRTSQAAGIAPRRTARRVTRRQAMLAASAVTLCGLATWSTLRRAKPQRASGPFLQSGNWRPLTPASPALLLPHHQSAQQAARDLWTQTGSDTFVVHSPDPLLLNLGQPVRGRFRLAVDLAVPTWHDSAGLFFSFFDQSDGNPTQRFQSVELVREGRDGEPRYRLVWSGLTVNGQHQPLKRDAWAAAEIPMPAESHSHLLELGLGLSGFPEVHWMGQLVPADRWRLSEEGKQRSILPDARLATEFLGHIGLVAGEPPADSAIADSASIKTEFRRPRLCYL